MINHLFDLESLLLCLGVAGVTLCVWGLLSAMVDLNYLTATGLNGPRRIVAVNNLVRQAFRLSIQVVVVCSGIFATLNQGYAHESDTALMMCFIVTISALVLIAEIVDRIRRHQLGRLFDRKVAEDARIGRRKTDATLAAICDHESARGR